MQHLIVSVAEILGRPGEYRDLDIEATLAEVGNALARLQEDPIQARLRAESVVEGVLVTGRVSGRASVECARCLTTRSEEVSLEVCELYVPAAAAKPDEDTYALSGTDMDLTPMLRDALILALPLNPVCRDDCRGLCARCGAELNLGPCDCTEDDVDPRWEALAAVRDRLTS